MSAEEPTYASLTAGLLARKGEAHPAMDGFTHGRHAPDNPGFDAAPVDSPAARRTDEPPLAATPPNVRRVERPSEEPERGPVNELRRRIADALGWDRNERRAPGGRRASERLADRAVRVASDTRPDPDCVRPCETAAASKRRIQVSFKISTRDFMRLKLASAELQRPSQDLLIDAVHEVLDAYGVERFEDCRCLAKAADRTAEAMEAKSAAAGPEPEPAARPDAGDDDDVLE